MQIGIVLGGEFLLLYRVFACLQGIFRRQRQILSHKEGDTMNMSKQEYQKYVQRKAQKSPIVKDTLCAFVIGGGICVIGQAIMNLALAQGLDKTAAGTVTTICLVGLSALLTGLNLYNKIARFGGAGTLVPVTGFANAVVSPAIDFRAEGIVTGMAAKMFLVAGPVLVFGTVAAALYGVILLLL